MIRPLTLLAAFTVVLVLVVAAWQAWLFVTGLADLLWILTLAAVAG